tara:strand:+ start:350 stop:811 length:462 start_codon:yes stop_codon:yes gene_type:complete
MTQTPDNAIPHNIRVIHTVNGDHVICNFTQVREDIEGESKFVSYQCLYPLTLSLTSNAEEDGQESFQVGYRRWNPYSPYEDVRINPSTVISAMPPAQDILQNYVTKLSDAGVDLGFLPNQGKDILGITDGEPTEEPTGAATEGPVAAGTGTGD